MEQDEAEAEEEMIAANQHPRWGFGSSVLAERHTPMNAHEGRAGQSLRFTQNADGERIVAAVQRPDSMGSQSPMRWELILSGATEAGNLSFTSSLSSFPPLLLSFRYHLPHPPLLMLLLRNKSLQKCRMRFLII
jgi:hypothetical protein